jgi:hypothetical protein
MKQAMLKYFCFNVFRYMMLGVLELKTLDAENRHRRDRENLDKAISFD